MQLLTALSLGVETAGGVFTGTTSGPSTQSGSCQTLDGSPENTFQWSPTQSGIATIRTCNATLTTYDTVLYMRTGSCQNGAEAACNDDTAGCFTAEPNDHHGSRITPTITAGQTYFIVVDGYNGASGAFTLSITAPSGSGATATPWTLAGKVRRSSTPERRTCTTRRSFSSFRRMTAPPFEIAATRCRSDTQVMAPPRIA